MKQTTAPKRETPSPRATQTKPHAAVGQSKSPSTVFIGMALDMSWRLAIAVLVPIIGGFELDQHLHSTPLLTIAGFVLAMGGMALVMWQTLQAANNLTLPKKGRQS